MKPIFAILFFAIVPFLFAGCRADTAYLQSAPPLSQENRLSNHPLNNLVATFQMDRSDLNKMGHIFEHSISGQINKWHNPASRNSYKVIPRPVFGKGAAKQPCRNAEIMASIGKKQIIDKVTTCKNLNGFWQIYRQKNM